MDFKKVTYTGDDGESYTLRIDSRYQSQAGLGWVENAGGPIPRAVSGNLRPRSVFTIATDGTKRRLFCGSKTATAYANPGATLITHHGPSDTEGTTAVVYGWEGEKVINDVPTAPTGA